MLTALVLSIHVTVSFVALSHVTFEMILQTARQNARLTTTSGRRNVLGNPVTGALPALVSGYVC